MDYEWLRFIVVGFGIGAIVQFYLMYRKTKQPGLFAVITWAVQVIAYEIFKCIVKSDPVYYNLSVFWVGIIFLQALVKIMIAGYFYDKKWTHTHPS
jgi:hypothetical protein